MTRGRLWITGALMALGLAGALPAAAYVSAPGVPDAEHASFEEVVEYYEKHYEHDANQIGRKAKAALVEEVSKRARRAHAPKPAIVFDIDDTALSLYECEKAGGDFGSTPLIGCVVGAGVETTAGTGKGLPRIEPVYKLFKKAQRLGVSVFFITGRPTLLVDAYKRNLRAQGYSGRWELTTFPSQVPPIGVPLAPYKSAARARIERQGHEIILNIGDQVSDLRGGYANRKFLMPNPMYFTP